MESRQIDVLGKKRGQQNREFAEFVMGLAERLPPADRALVTLVYGHGAMASTIAQATGVLSQTLYSRLDRLEKRLRRPEVRVLLDMQKVIPPVTRDIVTDYYFERISVADLAEKYKQPKMWVRQVIAKYREYFESMASKKKSA